MITPKVRFQHGAVHPSDKVLVERDYLVLPLIAVSHSVDSASVMFDIGLSYIYGKPEGSTTKENSPMVQLVLDPPLHLLLAYSKR